MNSAVTEWPRVNRFLKNLVLDEGLLQEYLESRQSALEDLELSKNEFEYLMEVSVDELAALLGQLDQSKTQRGSHEPNMGGGRLT